MGTTIHQREATTSLAGTSGDSPSPPELSGNAKRIFSDTSDRRLRLEIRALLPADALKRRPQRILFAPLLVLLIVVISVTIVVAQLPWYACMAFALLLGNFYGSLMFFAHEVGHGSVVRSRSLQDAVLYLGGAIFCLSPHLWRQWHNDVHHPHVNTPDRDPDTFGTYDQYCTEAPWQKFLLKFAPGSGHWLSAFYLPFFFTLHPQGVLWYKSRSNPEFRRLNRARAATDSLLMAAFWTALGIYIGAWASIFVIIIPFLVANSIVLGYVVTNHMLRAMSNCPDILSVTMSVTTSPLLDRLHFYFSHHVEHHLFPSMSSQHYPLVRDALRRLAPDRYLAPPHWWALLVLFATPRLYDGDDVLVEPVSGCRVSIAEVEEILSVA
jgi:fatty acid desaturase